MKDFKQSKSGYYLAEKCNLTDFQEIINQKLIAESVPNASEVIKNIPIYDISRLKDMFQNDELKSELMSEWAWVLRNYVKARQMSFYDILQMSLFRRCAKRGWDRIIK